MNLTKTVHKTPIDHTLEAQGRTHTEAPRPAPIYDDRYSWVSGSHMAAATAALTVLQRPIGGSQQQSGGCISTRAGVTRHLSPSVHAQLPSLCLHLFAP